MFIVIKGLKSLNHVIPTLRYILQGEMRQQFLK